VLVYWQNVMAPGTGVLCGALMKLAVIFRFHGVIHLHPKNLVYEIKINENPQLLFIGTGSNDFVVLRIDICHRMWKNGVHVHETN